jgi:hypothetical protein
MELGNKNHPIEPKKQRLPNLLFAYDTKDKTCYIEKEDW